MRNFSEALPPASKPISYLPVYSMKQIALARSQGLALLGFFPHALMIFPIITDHWSMRIFFFYLYDKALILKCSLILNYTNTKIWSKKWVCVLREHRQKTFVTRSRFWSLKKWEGEVEGGWGGESVKKNCWRKSFSRKCWMRF